MSHNESKEQSTDITNLQENFSKQQKKISALKELVRKSEVAHGKSTTSAQEKVKSIAQKLTHLKSKARSRQSSDVPSPQQQQNQHEDNVLSMPETRQSHSFSQQLHLSIMTPSSSHTSTPNPATPLKPQQQFGGSSTALTATPSAGSEKILLLRQQMEENKARMAQRASSKLHLEQLVTQLKEKFDTTQQYLEDTTELGKSMSDLSAFVYVPAATTRERHKSATDLTTQPFSLEKERMKFLENRCRLLEKQLEKERQANSSRDASLNESATSEASSKVIKELENKILEMDEVLKERQNAIEAKLQVEKDITTENSRLTNEIAQKTTEIEVLRTRVDLIEQPNEDNYSEINDLQNENELLRNELAEKVRRIAELEEVNDMLETTRCDLTMKNNQNEGLIQELQENLVESKEKVQQLQDELQQSEIKCMALQENFVTIESNATEAQTAKPTLDTDTQVQVEMAKQIQELQDELKAVKTENTKLKYEIDDNEKLEISDASIAEKISALEATIESQRDDLKKRYEIATKYEEELMEKTIELNVLNANFKVLEEKLQGNSKHKQLFSTAGASDTDNSELQAEIQQLKQKLDDSNKAMIKLKLKCKQSEKQIEKLKKNSDLHGEIVKLEKNNEELQQKITELEDEKGQWQLMQVVDVTESTEDDKNAATSLDEKCKTQAETIRLLEKQKYDHNEKLHKLQEQVQTLQQQLDKEQSDETARVKSQMSEIHLEEQLEEQTQQLQILQEKLEIKERELEEQQNKLRDLSEDKQNLDKKLEHYINENIELLDKVDKLSKSSSSAESIEIVERLTQQECAEIDEFNKRHEHEHEAHVGTEHAISSVNELTQTEMGPELSESLAKLREESSELMNKIELFTTERREVLEKMDHLTTENQELQRKVEEVMQEKELLETNVLITENAKSKLEAKLQEAHKEKELLASQVAESTAQKAQLSQELTSLQKSSEVVAALDSSEGATLFDKCEKSLSKLNSELVLYNKANDRNAKFNASKKLAKEAKNAYTQLSELLQKVKEASNAVETVTVVETVVAVTAPNGKALAEYEQLTAQNRQLKATVDELRRALQQLSTETDANYESTLTITEIPAAITQGQYETTHEQLKAAQDKIDKFEERCITLQTTVENLRLQLQEARTAGDERTTQITHLRKELSELQKINDDLDRLINDKEMSHEKQIEQLTRLRRELEGKCETYEGEMEILQTLVKEQKQQLIESYKENEHEINLKLLDLQQRDEQITQLRAEIQELKDTSIAAGEDLTKNLQMECEKLRESLKINKALVAEQVNELTNKQETIETLNQQIIDLYKTMEENTSKVIEKEDEITYLQDLVSNNSKELERFRKDNDQQKSVVDKLLSELHTHKATIQNLPLLESNLQRLNAANNELQTLNKELEMRNKEQLDKLKKYAANLKKRAAQCHEYEAKIKKMEEKGVAEAMQTKEHTETTVEEFKTNNIILNERINELELRLKQTETEMIEIKDALQLKTTELLENIENNAKLECEVKQLRESLHTTTQETVQLQNALAATQEQASGWGNIADETPITNNESLVKELTEKLTKLEENLVSKTKELEELRSNQAQTSDWGDFTLESASSENANNESLTKELAVKTANIEVTEIALNEVQAELLQMREMNQAKEEAQLEMQTTIKQKAELVESLQKQFESSQNEIHMLQEQLVTQNKHSTELSEELKAKSLKFEKSKAVIKERNNQIHRLQAQLKDLQDKLSAQPEEEVEQIEAPVLQKHLHASTTATTASVVSITKDEFEAIKQSYDKLNEKYNAEKATFEETIARLETLHDGIQAKLQEDLAYIETLEQENAKFKEKICKLEDCVACFEERRASMERRVNVLDAQMQSRADEYEKTEDELIYRLNMLSEHDDVIAQRLLSSQEEKDELLEKCSATQSELKELQLRFSKLENEHQNNLDNITNNLETELAHLRAQQAVSETEIQRMRSTYEAKLAAKTTELDELECELNDQLTKMNTEQRTLCENLERSRDECTLHKDEIVRLKESFNALEQSKQELEREVTWLRMQIDSSEQDQYELQELRMQTMQDKTEADNLRHQIETLAGNHEIELQGLRTQISELDTLRMQVGQNQTDDQVFIETENKRLTDLLAEKEALIDNYQRQNLQLQMAASASTSAQAQLDPLALAFGLTTPQSPSTTTINPIPAMLANEERERMQAEVLDKTELATRLQRDFNALQIEFHALLEGNNELQRQLAERNHEIENMRSSGITTATAFPNDVIPAPPMFFASDQMTPSPFDEIIQVRTHDNTLDASVHHRDVISDNGATNEQPTIEDLQRNVSDLEKHAQDLENKIAMRNQRESEFDEKMGDMQARLHDSENRLRDREQQLQNAQLELQKMKEETHALTQQQSDLQHNLQTLQWQLNNAEQQLKEREEQLKKVQMKLQFYSTPNENSTAENVTEQLRNNITRLEGLLQQREQELGDLKKQLSDEQHLKSTTTALEQQILTVPTEETQVDSFATSVGPTLDMFFGNVGANEFENLIIPPVADQLVVEEPIVPEKAYLCYPDGGETRTAKTAAATAATELDLGDDWGDSWSKEAEAEAKHFATTVSTTTATARQSLVPREQQLELQLQEKLELIQKLELSLERSEQQKQELQVKSGKLMKKLKEYKTKVDSMQASNVYKKSTSMESSSMFDDLDAAIQEELKTQIKLLETKLEEQLKNQENLTAEKEKLLKRIDVLTAGNERMSDMKERQDMDVQMYQARIRELQNKLNTLEDWDKETQVSQPEQVSGPPALPQVENATSVKQEKSWQVKQRDYENKISELSVTIQDVSADREELKALLDEEEANVKRAEDISRTLQQQIIQANEATNLEKSKHNELKLSYQNLQEKYNNIYEQNEKLSVELKTLKTECERLMQEEQNKILLLNSEDESNAESKLQDIQNEMQSLREALQFTEQASSELQIQLLELRTHNQELTQANDELRAATTTLANNNTEHEQLKDLNQELDSSKRHLEQQVIELQAEIVKLQTQSIAMQSDGRCDELAAQLQEKESEILHLKQRIEDLMREDQTEKLVLEILTKNQEIHMLKMQVKHLEEDKQELEHNVSLQNNKNLQTDKYSNAELEQLQEQIKQLDQQVRELQEEKSNMEEELKVLNNHVISSLELEDKMKMTVLELDTKNIEIAELRKSLEKMKDQNVDNELNNAGVKAVPEVDIVALNSQWEATVEQRCGEIAQMWQQYMQQREEEFKAVEARLNEELTTLRTSNNMNTIQQQQQQQQEQQQVISAETTATSTPASESTSPSGTSSNAGTPLHKRIINEENEADADAIIEKMQAALESQEIEIVTLKEQLAIRSAEYARLAAQYDPFKLQTTLSHSGVTTITGPSSLDSSQVKRNATGNVASSLVPKSELDLALYMLHQRDMRCEEMTVELVSLLEERDTLQLKLSNTLRQMEAIKTQTNYTEPIPTSQADLAAGISDNTDSSPIKLTGAGASASDSTHELNQKLSQLQTVNHSKDKLFKGKREQRLRQMEKIQQDVAKIPPAAVSELIGTDLSQSNQSPSSVLLNWLWGNTPDSNTGAGGGGNPHN